MFNFQGPSERVGHNNAEGPPVPIPNTEVKLCGADSTVLETVREGRTWPTPRPEKVASPWGCSSDGRAPALQAGGHGFESHHLHQGTRRVPSRRRDSNKSGVNDSPVDCQSRRRPRCVEHREGIPSSPPRDPEGPEQKKGFEQVGREGQSCGLSEPTTTKALRAPRRNPIISERDGSPKAQGSCMRESQEAVRRASSGAARSEWRNRKGSGLIAQQVRARA